MTRKELFAAVAKHADKLLWKLEMSPDGFLCFECEDDWLGLSQYTEDTDPDACVFIVWCLEFLNEHGWITGTTIYLGAATQTVEFTWDDELKTVHAPTLLDATLAAVVAVCDAMEEEKEG